MVSPEFVLALQEVDRKLVCEFVSNYQELEKLKDPDDLKKTKRFFGSHSFMSSVRSISQLVDLNQTMLNEETSKTSPNQSIKLLNDTNTVIRAVKDQLAEKWLLNREFLTTALKRLQHTTHLIENVVFEDGASQISSDNVYNLGLIRGGIKSPNILLFNLPNTGNLQFDFEIINNDSDTLFPQEFDYAHSNPFMIEPTSGTILPGESVNFSCMFQSDIAGYYQQSYSLQSGTEKIIAFLITAHVGIPNLVINPMILDFGLVARSKSVSRTIMLSNTGTFKDSWRVEPIVTTSVDSTAESNTEIFPFSVNPAKGELLPSEDQPLTMVFTAESEGNFFGKFKLLWCKESIIIQVKASGGGVRIKPIFSLKEDIEFAGIDFGRCIVGVTKEKKFQVTNIGNVDGNIDIGHTNQGIRFQSKRDSTGRIRINSGATLDVYIYYTPKISEIIKEPMVIKLPDNLTQMIPLKAFAGLCQWSLDGFLDFQNMHISEIQQRTLTLQNTGDIDIQFSVHLFPDTLSNTVQIKVQSFKEVSPATFSAPSKSTGTINVTIASESTGLVKGTFVVETDLGKGPVKQPFSFEFYLYQDQIALDNSQDASVGRIMVGESASVQRILTNFGNEAAQYRVRIETPIDYQEQTDDSSKILQGESKVSSLAKKGKSGPKKKKPAAVEVSRSTAASTLSSLAGSRFKLSPWKVNIDQGTLLPNQSILIEAIFESIDEYGDEWHEAHLIIEKLEDPVNDNWSLLKSIKLTGAGGKPDLVIEPAEVDFSYCAVQFSKKYTVTFQNKGTALLNYTIDPLDNSGVWKILDETVIIGKVEPGMIQEIPFLFCPVKEQSYETHVAVRTSYDVKTIVFKGAGITYKLRDELLPSKIDAGLIEFEKLKQIKVSLANNCLFEMNISAFVIINNNLKPENPIFDCKPSKMTLKGNTKAQCADNECSMVEFRIDIKYPTPIDDDLNVIDVEMSRLVKVGTQKCTLQIDIENGPSYTIPIIYNLVTKPIRIVSSEKYHYFAKESKAISIPKSEFLSFYSFGDVPAVQGAEVTLGLLNENYFTLEVEITVNNEQFSITPSALIMQTNELVEISLVFHPFNISDLEIIPQSSDFSGVVTIKSHINAVSQTVLDVSGTLVDIPGDLNIPDVWDFGMMLLGSKVAKNFSFQNPVRRDFGWEISINEQILDFFKISKPHKGTIKRGQAANIDVEFVPELAGSFTAKALLETDEGSYFILLQGVCVKPTISISSNFIDFGTVGIKDPEIKFMKIENTCEVSFSVFASTDCEEFSVNMSELILNRGETKELGVCFSPKAVGSRHTGKLILRSNNNDKQDGKALADILLEGKGGSFNLAEVTESGSSNQVTIKLEFANLTEQATVRKGFEIENCGDTVIVLSLFNEKDDAVPSVNRGNNVFSQKVSYNISPVSITLSPKQKQKVTVCAQGQHIGTEHTELTLKTVTLVKPKLLHVHLNSTVIARSDAGQMLSHFMHVDSSIEDSLDLEKHNAFKLSHEFNLWKIVFPIIRASPHLPSSDLVYVHPLEPHIVPHDINPFIIRPPAIPRELPPRMKKWYMNRMSMTLDQGQKNEKVIVNDNLEQRSEAARFVSIIEKRIFLEKRKR
ncbi:hypothetical protein BJ742DRAFT_825044 [Cladochytrium replicatum]|nr:hypothetical protein BJ742DRAFT_825044 [Cladochytrium replicatum]